MKSNNFRFFIETYGCQMNIYDADLITELLITHNFTPANTIHEAEVIILQTCSVRQHAEDRIRRRVEYLKSFKKNNPNIKIIISGCLSEHKGEEFLKSYPWIDFITGPQNYNTIIRFLNHTQISQNKVHKGYINFQNLQKTNPYFIPITRGCNNYCSYCIVPYLRGKEISRPPDTIIQEINSLDSDKTKEITLLGQNVNSYQYNQLDFPGLLKIIATQTNIGRIRFLTSHPKDITEKLVEAIAELDCLCEHIHLPVQSFSDHILKLMNRQYTAQEYLDKIEMIRKIVPKAGLSTDIIVGFPGETEDDFNATLKNVEKIGYEDAFMYKYSKREGTQAAAFQETLSEEQKITRLNTLINNQIEFSKEKLKERVGDTAEILVENQSKKSPNEYIGRSREHLMTVFPSENNVIGQVIKVKITEVRGKTLRGELYENS